MSIKPIVQPMPCATRDVLPALLIVLAVCVAGAFGFAAAVRAILNWCEGK